jgi:hypothetical protein
MQNFVYYNFMIGIKYFGGEFVFIFPSVKTDGNYLLYNFIVVQIFIIAVDFSQQSNKNTHSPQTNLQTQDYINSCSLKIF